MGAALASVGCTNAQLYDPVEIPDQANRIAFTGRVCTDNPAERSFPLRIVFAIDSSADPISGLGNADLAVLQTRRVDTLRGVVGSLRSRDTGFALIRDGGESLLQPEGGFTTNAVEMGDVAGAPTVAVPCTADGCRRTGQALSIASALVTGDLLVTPRGLRSPTKCVIVFVRNGPTDDVVLDVATTPACDVACVLQQRVAQLREEVLEGGGADLQVHTIDLATLDGNDGVRASAKSELQRMSFAGAGEYKPVCARTEAGTFVTPGCGPQNLSLTALDLNSARNVFLMKSFVVSNMNARTRPDGTVFPESDGDGLSAEEEAIYGTDPTLRDSGFDGIGDKVELLLQTTGLNPLVADDPVTCAYLAPAVRFVIDSDGDGLLDGEEALLRLDPTLFDTDGDGIPDPLAVFAGTNFPSDDGLQDADFDSVSNIDELRAHTNPRAADSKMRNELSYLYREVDLGVRSTNFTSQPRRITGVVIKETGAISSLGNGALTFLRVRGRTFLAWRDAAEPNFGNAVLVDYGGDFRLDAPAALHRA